MNDFYLDLANMNSAHTTRGIDTETGAEDGAFAVNVFNEDGDALDECFFVHPLDVPFFGRFNIGDGIFAPAVFIVERSAGSTEAKPAFHVLISTGFDIAGFDAYPLTYLEQTHVTHIESVDQEHGGAFRYNRHAVRYSFEFEQFVVVMRATGGLDFGHAEGTLGNMLAAIDGHEWPQPAPVEDAGTIRVGFFDLKAGDDFVWTECTTVDGFALDQGGRVKVRKSGGAEVWHLHPADVFLIGASTTLNVRIINEANGELAKTNARLDAVNAERDQLRNDRAMFTERRRNARRHLRDAAIIEQIDEG